MPFCPNCGSYVSLGTNVCSCGTTFGYRRKLKKKQKQSLKNSKEKEEMLSANIIAKQWS